MEVACLVKLQPQIEAICDAAQFVPCAAFPSSLLCSITSLWQTCSCHHCSSAVVLSGVGTVQQWGWGIWARAGGAGLGPSCILDIHWIELCILEGKEKTHILRVLWRFRALYQKAALMESLGGGSVKQKISHCFSGCVCAELAAGDLPSHGVHRWGTQSQKSLLGNLWN